jgi:hypothetical protein
MAQRAEQEQENQQKIAEAEQIQKALELSQIDQNTALAEERRARVLSDIGLAKERMSEMDQNYAKALLDNAKTVTEIQDMDRKRLLDVMKIASDLKIQHEINMDKQLTKDSQRI